MGDETKVQMKEMKKGVEAMGSVAERYLMRMLGPVGAKIQRSTRAGRIMALVGVIAVAVALVLIFADALSFSTEIVKGTLIVARPVVNLRDKAAAKGKVVAKAERGEPLSYLASSDGWYKVRARSGTGWVSHEMVERKGNRSLVVAYEMKGYGIVFLAGAGLFILGLMQKKK